MNGCSGLTIDGFPHRCEPEPFRLFRAPHISPRHQPRQRLSAFTNGHQTMHDTAESDSGKRPSLREQNGLCNYFYNGVKNFLRILFGISRLRIMGRVFFLKTRQHLPVRTNGQALGTGRTDINGKEIGFQEIRLDQKNRKSSRLTGNRSAYLFRNL